MKSVNIFSLKLPLNKFPSCKAGSVTCSLVVCRVRFKFHASNNVTCNAYNTSTDSGLSSTKEYTCDLTFNASLLILVLFVAHILSEF